MIDRTELDVRFLNHAARVAHADRFGALNPAARRGPHSPRWFVAILPRHIAARRQAARARQSSTTNPVAA